MATPSAPAKALSLFTQDSLLARYGVVLFWAVAFALCSWFAAPLFRVIGHENPAGLTTLLEIVVIGGIGFASYYSARRLPVPPFVIAIGLGFLAKPLLAPITGDISALSALVLVAAALILFQGGLETDRGDFKRLLPKIASLAILGVTISAIVFAFVLLALGALTGAAVSIVTAVLLSVALASTDPAAIMPIMDELDFGANRDMKDIVVSESALNDVVGTLLTLPLVAAAAAGVVFGSVMGSFGMLVSGDSAIEFAKQAGFGTLGGAAGFGIMRLHLAAKKRHDFTHGADVALFLIIALISGLIAGVAGGSIFLAAFIAGLFFHLEGEHAEARSGHRHFKVFERHFNDVIDGWAKPIIFGLLGALVNFGDLVTYAPIGILASIAFMALVRPACVLVCLAPFMRARREPITVKQVLFISCVRATGVIPAMLLITIMGMRIPGTEPLLAIGMWPILATLIVNPLLVRWTAPALGIAKPKSLARQVREETTERKAEAALILAGK